MKQKREVENESGSLLLKLEMAKSIFNVASYVLVYFALGFFFFGPNLFSDFLYSHGFKGIRTPVGDLEVADNSARSAGLAVSDILQNKPIITEHINKISELNTDPKIKLEIEKLKTDFDSIEKKALSADESLKQNIETQQRILIPEKQNVNIKEGWMFFGSVTEDKKSWIKTAKKTVGVEIPDFQVGQSISVTDAVYLHADDVNKMYAHSSIVSVVGAGNMVEIEELYYSGSKKGGLVLWAKIKTKIDK